MVSSLRTLALLMTLMGRTFVPSPGSHKRGGADKHIPTLIDFPPKKWPMSVSAAGRPLYQTASAFMGCCVVVVVVVVGGRYGMRLK